MGTTGKTRSTVLPDVPTLAEAGVPGYESGIWLGLMAPKATPRPVLERLNVEINKIISSADVREAWTRQGAQPMGMAIDQFDKFLRAEIVKWAKVVKLSGAKVD
jgi:tripartite-type tricarboxylate transporter receptor subunit TctC